MANSSGAAHDLAWSSARGVIPSDYPDRRLARLTAGAPLSFAAVTPGHDAVAGIAAYDNGDGFLFNMIRR
jgi:hypothetical protein